MVSGSKGRDYRVNLENPSCTCPDWQKRRPSGGCKHILHVKIEKGETAPIPSAKTNFGNPQSRSRPSYPSNWDSLSERTKKRDDWTCQKCGAKGGPYGSARLAAHHMKPKSHGGRDDLDNLITVCHSCHEEEHGHSIPKGGKVSLGTGAGSRTETDAPKSLVEIENEEDEFDDEYGPHGPFPESSFPRSPSPETESDSESSDIKDTPAESSTQTSEGRCKTQDLIPSAPAIKEGLDHEALGSRAEPFIIAAGSMMALVLLRGILLIGQLSDIMILAIAGLIYIAIRAVNKVAKERIETVDSLNTEFENISKTINNNISSNKPAKEKEVEKAQTKLEEIEDYISDTSLDVDEEYLNWISKSKEKLEEVDTTPSSVSKGLEERQHYEKHQ